LWSATLLHPDSTPPGATTTQMLTEPRHGEARIADDPLFPNYLAPNSRLPCDARKEQGRELFYTPAADFHDHDKVMIRNATSDGPRRRIIIDMDVRQEASKAAITASPVAGRKSKMPLSKCRVG
jgi:hypothetical protein